MYAIHIVIHLQLIFESTDLASGNYDYGSQSYGI